MVTLAAPHTRHQGSGRRIFRPRTRLPSANRSIKTSVEKLLEVLPVEKSGIPIVYQSGISYRNPNLQIY